MIPFHIIFKIAKPDRINVIAHQSAEELDASNTYTIWKLK